MSLAFSQNEEMVEYRNRHKKKNENVRATEYRM